MKNRRILYIITVGYLAIAIACLVILPTLAQGPWPRSPFCGENERFYNNAFTNGLLGWEYDCPITKLGLFGPESCVQAIDDVSPYTLRLRNGATIIQSVELPPGQYTFNVGMILQDNSPICPGTGIDQLLSLPSLHGGCEAVDPGEWQGEHWGQIRLFWKGALLTTHDIPNGLPHGTYYQFEYPFVFTDESSDGDFKVQLWSSAWCSYFHNLYTKVDLDWVSMCRVPPDTPTPTVTGTPPDTPTPTTTPTVFCEATDYPTGTPYPSSTPYPTNTPWLTPPVLLTQTPLPTYTPWPTCVPTATKTPYASPTPFRFGVPLTYTNQFGELRQGMSEFFTSTEGLLGDVSGLLISASVAVSDVTSFGVTNTVTISGTPVTTTDMVTTFVSNMDALRYVFGWFGTFRLLAPGPFWFMLLCIAWTVLVLAIKFVSNFLATVIWPLARTVWDVVIDIWNAIPFL